eukprot:133832-Rhodomonas_salina.1
MSVTLLLAYKLNLITAVINSRSSGSGVTVSHGLIIVVLSCDKGVQVGQQVVVTNTMSAGFDACLITGGGHYYAACRAYSARYSGVHCAWYTGCLFSLVDTCSLRPG